MENKITYDLIKSFNPCYTPEKIGIAQGYSATIPDFIKEYRDKVHNKQDILWTLCRHEFMTDKELRLYAVWCARQIQHLMTDERSINALDVAERYANGLATREELSTARAAAWDAAWDAASRDAARAAAWAAAWAVAWAAARDAAWDAAWAAAWDATRDAAWDAARAAAWDAAWDAARDAQIDKLLEVFESKEND